MRIATTVSERLPLFHGNANLKNSDLTACGVTEKSTCPDRISFAQISFNNKL